MQGCRTLRACHSSWHEMRPVNSGWLSAPSLVHRHPQADVTVLRFTGRGQAPSLTGAMAEPQAGEAQEPRPFRASARCCANAPERAAVPLLPTCRRRRRRRQANLCFFPLLQVLFCGPDMHFGFVYTKEALENDEGVEVRLPQSLFAACVCWQLNSPLLPAGPPACRWSSASELSWRSASEPPTWRCRSCRH